MLFLIGFDKYLPNSLLFLYLVIKNIPDVDELRS